MPTLNLSDVSLSLGKSNIINNVSLTLNAGEILAIVGPNGAGKSSLLKAICGDVPISAGEISLFGKILEQWDIRELATKRAMLPQLSLLNFPYTVEEVIAIGRSPQNRGYKVDAAVINHVIETFDLVHLKQREYTQLSGGEKQRTQLARVIAQVCNPESLNEGKSLQSALLLLDEPGSALDLLHQQQLTNTLQNLAHSGLSIVLVVHDLNTAAKIADKILLLCCGQAMAYGSPTEVLQEAILEQTFGAKLSVTPHPSEDRLLVIA